MLAITQHTAKKTDMKKGITYFAGLIFLVIVGYNSVYFKKLDEAKASKTNFDPKSYARKYFDKEVIPGLDNAIELNQLLRAIKIQKDSAFTKYSHALGIGNIAYFMVNGKGRITSLNENDVSVSVVGDSTRTAANIATEFVFGNAIRDASGKLNINAFNNTMDFNNVSAEINKIVRQEVLPPFKTSVQKGDSISFAGAIELNGGHLNTDRIEILPVQLKIVR